MNGGAATREQIYAALFTLLSNAYAWNLKSRRLKHYSQVDWPNQPAMFMTQVGEQATTSAQGLPLRWSLDVKLWVYTNVGQSEDTVPASAANDALDAIEAALRPTRAGDKQTLGGLCFNCYIDGKVESDEGWLGPQSVWRVPIRIIAPA